MMDRQYRYIGPGEIRAKGMARPGGGTEVRGPADVAAWARASGQTPGGGETLAVTFVIDEHGRLRIADRRSEHVACAGGGDVLSAGEMFFAMDGDDVRAEEVSNQSTGYCPEPESWEAVGGALDRAGIAHPGGFTNVCVFRRCEACGEANIVKDGWYYCELCGAKLPGHWNFG